MAITTPNPNESAPFNMAINCLMRIADMIKALGQVSAGFAMGEIHEGQNYLGIKYMLVRQLYIQAIPLLVQPEEKEIQDMLNKIKLPKPINKSNSSGSDAKCVYPYSLDIENSLDNVVIAIQNALQKHGYFMPPKNDPRFSWKH